MTDPHAGARASEPDYRAILLSLCASLTLCDHMGDVSDYVFKALEMAGVKVDEDDDGGGEWTDEVQRTLHAMGVKTLYNTSVGDEDESDD